MGACLVHVGYKNITSGKTRSTQEGTQGRPLVTSGQFKQKHKNCEQDTAARKQFSFLAGPSSNFVGTLIAHIWRIKHICPHWGSNAAPMGFEMGIVRAACHSSWSDGTSLFVFARKFYVIMKSRRRKNNLSREFG